MSNLLTRLLTASFYSFVVLCSLSQVLRIILVEKESVILYQE